VEYSRDAVNPWNCSVCSLCGGLLVYGASGRQYDNGVGSRHYDNGASSRHYDNDHNDQPKT